LKALLSEMGLCTAEVRLPLVRASAGLQKKIVALAAALKK
jgi:dihydrodipicolinate synthase/N-acetylneuraminate lyase